MDDFGIDFFDYNIGAEISIIVNGKKYIFYSGGKVVNDAIQIEESGYIESSIAMASTPDQEPWYMCATFNISDGYIEELKLDYSHGAAVNQDTFEYKLTLESYGTYYLMKTLDSWYIGPEDSPYEFSNPIEVTSPIQYYIDTLIDFVDPVLNNNSWATIAEMSRKGLASKVWKVGDWKYLDMTKYDYQIEVEPGFYSDDGYSTTGGNFTISNKEAFLQNINFTPGRYKIEINSAPDTIIYNASTNETIFWANWNHTTETMTGDCGFNWPDSDEFYSKWGPGAWTYVTVVEDVKVSEPTYKVDWVVDKFKALNDTVVGSGNMEEIDTYGVSINTLRLINKINARTATKDVLTLIFSSDSKKYWNISGDYTATRLSTAGIKDNFGCNFVIKTTDGQTPTLDAYVDQYGYNSWNVQFTVTLTKTEQGKYAVQIIGFDHDNVTDPATYGRKKAGITFALGRTAAGSDFNRNEPGLYQGILSIDSDIFYYGNTKAPLYWPTSKFRQALQTLLDGTKVAPYMVAVDKQNVNKYNANIKWADTEFTSDKVSLPSEYEVWGETQYGYYQEGEQYEFWKDFNSKFRYFGGNAPCSYWLRTSAVPTNGNVLNTPASESKYNCYVNNYLTFKQNNEAVRGYKAGSSSMGHDVAPIFFI
jgi:hypothetical protein